MFHADNTSKSVHIKLWEMPNTDNYVKNSEDEHGKHYLNENLVKCMEVLVGTSQMHTPLPTDQYTHQRRKCAHCTPTTTTQFTQHDKIKVCSTILFFHLINSSMLSETLYNMHKIILKHCILLEFFYVISLLELHLTWIRCAILAFFWQNEPVAQSSNRFFKCEN